MKETIQRLREVWRDVGKMRGMLIALVCFYLLIYSPILGADFLYRDDLRRAAIGFRGWGYGRYLSLLCSVILHTDTFLTDISPLPQILGGGVMGFASLLLVLSLWKWEGGEAEGEPRQAGGELRQAEGEPRQAGGEQGQEPKEKGRLWPWWGRMALAVAPLGIYPCFLNCVCYKYDAPYMALSVLFSILPLALSCYGLRGWRACIFTALCSLGMCMTYQASSGILPVLVLLFFLFGWVRGERFWRLFLWALSLGAGYLGGLLLYWSFFMKDSGEYVSASLGERGSFLARTLENDRRYLERTLTDSRGLWLLLMGILALLFFVRVLERGRGRRLILILILALLPLPLWMVSLGAYPFLEKPLFLPRAMYGPGALLAGMALYAAFDGQKGESRGKAGSEKRRPVPWRLYSGAVLLILCLINLSFGVFSFTLGNALSAQAEYTRFRLEEVLMDLSSLPGAREGEEIGVQLEGNIGFAPMIQNLPEDYEMIRRIVPSTLKGDYMWGEYGLFHYYKLEAQKLEGELGPLPELSKTRYHVIYGSEGRFLIRLL